MTNLERMLQAIHLSQYFVENQAVFTELILKKADRIEAGWEKFLILKQGSGNKQYKNGTLKQIKNPEWNMM